MVSKIPTSPSRSPEERGSRRACAAGWVGGLWVLLLPFWVFPAFAHEIPTDVRVKVHVRATDEGLTVLMRAPLEAMRDFDFATRGPGYLDLEAVGGQLEDAARLWLLDNFRLYGNGRLLTAGTPVRTRVSAPSDRTFDDYAAALAAFDGPGLPPDTDLYWAQALLDVAVVYPVVDGADVEFEIEPGFATLGLRTVTEIRFTAADGTERGLSFVGDPGRVSLDPSAWSVFVRFVAGGFDHVLGGLDHLLFVFALVVPVLMIRPLIVVVTAFTLAHSITLAAAMLNLVPTGLWFPPFVELAIAVSILYMALENVLRPSLGRRWLVAFVFGLVHGFGFSFALQDTMQFAGDHLATSLLGFNLGIEAGQILVLLAVVPVLRFLSGKVRPDVLRIVLSALIAHSAWHWSVERWEAFSAYSVPPPVLDAAFAADLMRWLLLACVAGLVVWLVRVPFSRWASVRDTPR
jgi:hypothetical protein